MGEGGVDELYVLHVYTMSISIHGIALPAIVYHCY